MLLGIQNRLEAPKTTRHTPPPHTVDFQVVEGVATLCPHTIHLIRLPQCRLTTRPTRPLTRHLVLPIEILKTPGRTH